VLQGFKGPGGWDSPDILRILALHIKGFLPLPRGGDQDKL